MSMPVRDALLILWLVLWLAVAGCGRLDPSPPPPPGSPPLEPVVMESLVRATQAVESWPAAERLGQAIASATYWQDWEAAAEFALDASVREAEIHGRDYSTVRHAARLTAAMAAWQKATRRKPAPPQ